MGGIRRHERVLAVTYLAGQALACALWWAALAGVPAVRTAFELAPAHHEVLDAFVAGDLVVFLLGSALGAWGLARRAAWAPMEVAGTAGGAAYATLYLAGWTGRGGAGALGLVCMVPATILTAAVARCASRLASIPTQRLTTAGVLAVVGRLLPRWAFRPARPAGPGWNGAKTGAQIVVAWGFALGLLPVLAQRVDGACGLGSFGSIASRGVGGVVFAVASAVGIASAWVMVTRGRGTPVPFDAARELVVSGTYRVVRNPMVVSGIGQSIGVALLLGSPLATLLPVAGALVWNEVLRPPEERFLVERFGESYQDYHARVRCWIPKRSPYPSSRRGQWRNANTKGWSCSSDQRSRARRRRVQRLPRLAIRTTTHGGVDLAREPSARPSADKAPVHRRARTPPVRSRGGQ